MCPGPQGAPVAVPPGCVAPPPGWADGVDADAVLRAQGADPARVRERGARGARAVAVAEAALAEGLPLAEPRLVVARLPVVEVRHARVRVGGDRPGRLSGPLVTQHLAAADELVAIVCTVGPALEELAAALVRTDPARAVALDAVGSAAVEALATAATVQVEQEAEAAGLCSSLPISPGLLGWPVDQGQPQLLALLDAGAAGITLTHSAMMLPRKSRSLVLGVGPHVGREGEICDFCALRASCTYRTAPGGRSPAHGHAHAPAAASHLA